MNDAPRVVRGLEDEPPLPLSDAAYAMLELLPAQMTAILHGSEDSLTIGIWGFVTECHRLALSKQVVDFGPDDIVALIRRHPTCRWHGLAMLESDVAEGWRECLAKARADLERRMKARELAETLFDPWADLPPPEWPRGVLRPDYEATIAALAKRDGCDLGALSMAYVVAISGAAHKDVRFEPFQHAGWQVPPIIYAMPIADSGFRKTPLIHAAFAAIVQRDRQEWRTYQLALADYEAATDKREQDKPKEPSPLIVEDISVETLQALLARSPRGALMLRDEIAPMFDFRRYSRGVGAAERAFYLRAYEGGMMRVHRIGRATDHGDTIGLALFGCVQPDRLADFKDLGSDGLMQRFVPLVIAERRLSEPDTIVHCKRKLDDAIDLLMVERGHDVYRTTPEGSALIRETEIAGQALSEVTDYGKSFQGFCSKLHGLHARLAFLLHLLDDQNNAVIPAETIERAARLTMFCVGHARAFYSRAPGSVLEITKAVAGYILTHSPLAAGDTERIVASSITSGVRACRGMSLKRLAEVLAPLVAGGWLTPETPFGDCNAWLVTNGLREAFSARRADEAERRAATRALILEVSAGRVPRRRS